MHAWHEADTQACCADVRALIRDKLGISAGTPASVIADKVNKSIYAKDYFMDKDYVRNLRVKHVDILWRLRARDVESMQLLVRCPGFVIGARGVRWLNVHAVASHASILIHVSDN